MDRNTPNIEQPKHARGWTLVRGAGFALLGVVTLFIVAVGLLHTSPALTWAVNAGLSRISMNENTSLNAERVSGSPFGTIRIKGLFIRDEGGKPMVQVDSAAVNVSLLSLLTSHIRVASVEVVRPRIDMRQRADSSWDLLSSFPQDTTASRTFSINEATVREGAFSLRYSTPRRDSTYRDSTLTAVVERLNAHDVAFGESFSVDLDSLSARFKPAGSDDTVQIHASGAYTPRRVRLDHLSLRSDNSELSASGYYLPSDVDGRLIDGVDLEVKADPIAFSELRPFLPGLAPDVSATLELLLTDANGLVRLDVNGLLSDGGRFTAQGLVAPYLKDKIAVDGEVTLTQFNPGVLGLPVRGPTSGRLKIDVAGPALSRLDGDLRLDFDQLAVRDIDVRATRLAARFQDGTAFVDGATTIAGAKTNLTGRTQPFAEVPTYNVQVAVRDLDVSRFQTQSDQPSIRSGLNGDVVLQGTRDDASAQLKLLPSTVGNGGVGPGTVSVRVLDTITSFQIDAAVSGGRTEGRGRIAFGDELRLDLDRLSMREVDVLALIGDTTSSYVTAEFALSGFLGSLQQVRLGGTARWDTLGFGDLAVSAGSAQANLLRGSIEITGSTRLGTGSMGLQASGRPFDTQRSFQVTRLDLAAVDLASTLGPPYPETSLNGRLSGRVAGPALNRLSGNLMAAFDSSLVNREIVVGSGTVQFEDGSMSADLDLGLSDGRLLISGSIKPGGAWPVTLERATFGGLDLSRLLGLERWETNLNGTMAGHFNNLSQPGQTTGSFALSLANARINQQDSISATVDLAADIGAWESNMDVRWPRGAAEAELHGRLGGNAFPLAGTVDFSHLRPDLIWGDSLALEASARVTMDIVDLRAPLSGSAAQIAIRPGRFGDVTIEGGLADVRLDSSLLRVDSLHIVTTAGTVDASGIVALSDKAGTSSEMSYLITLSAASPLPRLPPLWDQATALGTIAGQLSGPPGNLRFTGDADLQRVSRDDVVIDRLLASGSGTLDAGLNPSTVAARVRAEQVTLPGLFIRDARMDASFENDSLHLEVETILDNERSAFVQGRAVMSDEDPAFLLDSLRVALPGADWQLLQPSRIVIKDGYQLRNLLVYTDDQQIAVDGVIDLDGEVSLIMTIEAFQIGSVADLLGYEGLAGTVDGYIDLTGLAAAPLMNGELSLDVSAYGNPVGDMSVTLAYEDQRLQTDALLSHVDNSTMSFNGFVPVDLRLLRREREDAPGMRIAAGETSAESLVDFTITADSFAVDWLQPFISRGTIDEIEGRVDGTVAIKGTFDEPDLQGRVQLHDGRYRIPVFNVTHHDVRADLAFSRDTIAIEHLEIESGPGSVVGVGNVVIERLSRAEYDISFSAEDFLAANSREYDNTTVSADLLMFGPSNAPTVSGHILVEAVNIFLTPDIEEFEPVSLTSSDIAEVRETFGVGLSGIDTTTFDFYEALTLDLNLQLERNSWLRSRQTPRMNIEFEGDLIISKQPQVEPEAFGRVDIIPDRSEIIQLGQRFSIERGTILYNGPIDQPVLDIEAQYVHRSRTDRENEVTITMNATGRAETLNVELSSVPELDQTDIISYLVVGRPARETLRFGSGSAGTTLARDIALSQAAGYLEGIAGSELGLDVVQIETSGTDTKLTAGKYLRKGIFVAISQPISFSSTSSQSQSGAQNVPEFTVEVELRKSLLLRFLQSGPVFRVNLHWQQSY